MDLPRNSYIHGVSMGTDFGRYFGEYLSVGTLHFRVSAGDHKEMDPPLCKAKFEVYQGAFGSTD